jgi:adenosine deaminase
MASGRYPENMNNASAEYRMPGGRTSITALPKVALHEHLDGGLRPQTIIDLAAEIGLELPTTDEPALRAWFVDQSSTGSLVDFLKTFDITTAVMQTAPQLERVAKEFVLDLAADGVIYGEIRWAPEQHLAGGLSLDQAVEAIQAGIDAGIDEAAASGHEIRIGQLISAMRQNDRGLEIAELAVRHRANGVVGFDIAGPEAGFPPSRMSEAFDYLAKNYLPRTVHAGEADGIASIEGALFDGRALRLGHGVRIADDITITSEDEEAAYVQLGPVAQWVKDREITLEVCPTSNLLTNAASTTVLADHPFDLLYQLGFRVTVSTDDRLMTGTTISQELSMLVDAFGYDLTDLEVFQLNAAESAFLPIDDREELADRISAGFEQA